MASFPPAPGSLLSGINTADCGCRSSLGQANGLRSPGTRLESVLGPLCCRVRAAAGAGMGACCLQFSLGRRVFLWVSCGHVQLEVWPGCCFPSSLACLPFPVATWLCTPSSHLAPRVTEAASRRSEGPARASRDRRHPRGCTKQPGPQPRCPHDPYFPAAHQTLCGRVFQVHLQYKFTHPREHHAKVRDSWEWPEVTMCPCVAQRRTS